MSLREDQIKEMHTAFGQAVDAEPTIEVLQLRRTLIEEEVKELFSDIDTAIVHLKEGKAVPKDLYANMLKEMVDVQVVLCGTAVSLKPLNKFDEAFQRVHASNMSKLGLDGKAILREDGKILKGPHFFKPDLADLV